MSLHDSLSRALLATSAGLLATACLGASDDLDRDPLGDELSGDVAATLSRAELLDRERVEPSSLEKIDNGDGTWSYDLPPGFDPTVVVEGNVLSWRYVGQARFAYDPQPPTGTRYHVVRAEQPQPAEDQLAQLRRIDRFGRMWRATAVDSWRWTELVEPAPAETEDDAIARAARADLEPELPVGTVVPWQPMSWSHLDCDGGLDREVHLWNGEGRVAKTGALTERQRTIVQVNNTAFNARCTGVLLAQDVVLTAAHCLQDFRLLPIEPEAINVCPADGSSCRRARDYSVSDRYSDVFGTDFADDWAIIELQKPWATPMPYMTMSAASDTTIENLTNVHNLALPKYARYCTDRNGAMLFHNQEQEPVAGITRRTLRLKLDGSPGHSGSPVYYCPAGDDNVCGPGERGYVIAVFAGWNPAIHRFVGPKVSSFRAAALAFIND